MMSKYRWCVCVNSAQFMAWWYILVIKIWVNISSGNGLLPDGTKRLPEPVLTYINVVLWILPRAISQDMLNISVLDINLNISHLRLQPHLTGANKLVPSFCDSYSLIHSDMIPQSLGHGGCYEGARKCYSTHYIPIVVKVKFMASGVINEKYTLILFVYCILLMFWRFLTLSFPCVFITYKAMFDVCVIPVISSI